MGARRPAHRESGTAVVIVVGAAAIVLAARCGAAHDSPLVEAVQRCVAQVAEHAARAAPRVAPAAPSARAPSAASASAPPDAPARHAPVKRVKHAAPAGDLFCRDGSTSPTCTCAGSHRGCCSWHGGVAGCEPPRRH